MHCNLELEYSIDGGSQIFASISGNIVSFTSALDFYGVENFTATVSDGEYSSSQSFDVTVNPINDAPILSNIDTVVFDEDGFAQIELSASDVDNEDLTFSIVGGNEITATVTGNIVTFNATQDFNGSESFTAYVSDGEAIDSQAFVVQVLPINDAPVIDLIANQNTDEDTPITINLSANDIDSDIFRFYLKF